MWTPSSLPLPSLSPRKLNPMFIIVTRFCVNWRHVPAAAAEAAPPPPLPPPPRLLFCIPPLAVFSGTGGLSAEPAIGMALVAAFDNAAAEWVCRESPGAAAAACADASDTGSRMCAEKDECVCMLCIAFRETARLKPVPAGISCAGRGAVHSGPTREAAADARCSIRCPSVVDSSGLASPLE